MKGLGPMVDVEISSKDFNSDHTGVQFRKHTRELGGGEQTCRKGDPGHQNAAGDTKGQRAVPRSRRHLVKYESG